MRADPAPLHGRAGPIRASRTRKEPVVTALRSPHWASSSYELTKLEHRKGVWGKGDGIHTLAREGFAADEPEVAAWLRSFKLTEEPLTGLKAQIQQTGKGEEQQAVRAWLQDHPEAAALS
ncbi:glycine betaine ABC transporter substrate-binding protein [Streptomyces sp. NPDC060232]|uniref:glycine betaine ABC transporter substrate-binding protein n=1 Tax=Streptomyces sp. NPDC060232 TaxID=3347079 RepID=UPI00364E2A79